MRLSKRSGAAADVTYAFAFDRSHNPVNACCRIVGPFVNTRMIAVKFGIFLRGKEWRPFAKSRKVTDMITPDTLRRPAKDAGVPQKWRQNVFENEANSVRGFSVHENCTVSR